MAAAASPLSEKRLQRLVAEQQAAIARQKCVIDMDVREIKALVARCQSYHTEIEEVTVDRDALLVYTEEVGARVRRLENKLTAAQCEITSLKERNTVLSAKRRSEIKAAQEERKAVVAAEEVYDGADAASGVGCVTMSPFNGDISAPHRVFKRSKLTDAADAATSGSMPWGELFSEGGRKLVLSAACSKKFVLIVTSPNGQWMRSARNTTKLVHGIDLSSTAHLGDGHRHAWLLTRTDAVASTVAAVRSAGWLGKLKVLRQLPGHGTGVDLSGPLLFSDS